jgi:uncharacterized protein (TIGR02147 family)
MIDVFHHATYRDWLIEHVERHRTSYRRIATASAVNPSYFSRVMQGKAEFSRDQMFKIAEAMALQGWQRDLFLLLGDEAAASNHRHKTYLRQKIDALRHAQEKVVSRFAERGRSFVGSPENLASYYDEVVTAKIHMLLTVDAFRRHPDSIAAELGLTREKLRRELAKLSELGLIAPEKAGGRSGWKVLQDFIHLDEDSPISARNHVNWRIDAIQRLQQRSDSPDDYHFSGVFSADAETKAAVRKALRDALVAIGERVAKAKAEAAVYSLCMDLY